MWESIWARGENIGIGLLKLSHFTIPDNISRLNHFYIFKFLSKISVREDNRTSQKQNLQYTEIKRTEMSEGGAGRKGKWNKISKRFHRCSADNPRASEFSAFPVHAEFVCEPVSFFEVHTGASFGSDRCHSVWVLSENAFLLASNTARCRQNAPYWDHEEVQIAGRKKNRASTAVFFCSFTSFASPLLILLQFVSCRFSKGRFYKNCFSL